MTPLRSRLKKIISGKTMPYSGDMYSNLAYTNSESKTLSEKEVITCIVIDH